MEVFFKVIGKKQNFSIFNFQEFPHCAEAVARQADVVGSGGEGTSGEGGCDCLIV